MPQLELALLGAFVQLGWPKAYGAANADDSETRNSGARRARLVVGARPSWRALPLSRTACLD